MPEPDLTHPASVPPAPGSPPPRGWGDWLFARLCQVAAASVVLLVAALVVVLIWGAWPTLTQLGRLQVFTSAEWKPHPPPGQEVTFGALGFIYGTLITSAIAMCLAVPLGVGAAAFLSEIAPGWLRRAGAFLIELLAAIPSVVYGFWGLMFLAPGLQWLFDRFDGPNTGGQGLLAAGLILAIMILPYITAISFDVMRAVPRSQREGALALGATRWQMIWSVLLPYARPGIIAACFLALGRALGETMAVTMLVGNVRGSIESPIFGLGDSLASVIANSVNEADSNLHRSALVMMGLILFVITAGTNLIARYMVSRIGRTQVPRAAPAPATDSEVSPPTPTRPEPPEPTPPPEVEVHETPRHRATALRTDRVMTITLALCQVVTTIPLFLILGYIVYRGIGALDVALFTELPKDLFAEDRGLGHAMLGSLYMVLTATAFAVPLSVTTAIFLTEYPKHPMARPVRFLAELLGGVPSIVIGIFAYTLWVRPLGLGQFSGWAGVFALGVMMVPVVVRSSEEAMKLVPSGLRQASYALGASQWQTVTRVILPAALPAIITGVFLALGRIAGETAPLLLTAYGSNYWPESLNTQTPFLPGYIYNFSTSAEEGEREMAWGAALVLVTFVMLLNIGIRLAAGRRVIAASRAD